LNHHLVPNADRWTADSVITVDDLFWLEPAIAHLGDVFVFEAVDLERIEPGPSCSWPEASVDVGMTGF
jgi:hypothetical protein